MNYANGQDFPMGFGMALAQNSSAMTRFAGLSDDEKRAIIEGTHAIHSKQEMQEYVKKLTVI